MPKELPDGAWFVERRLSLDKYQGQGSAIAQTAYEIYQKRLQNGTPGSAESDWREAENIIRERFLAEMFNQGS